MIFVEEIKDLCRMKTEEMETFWLNVFKKFGYSNIVGLKNNYYFAEGDIPICIVCHIDTVFNFPPTIFFNDKEQKVLISPEGAGFDDRAGNYILYKLLEYGYRPSIIISCNEESGCAGMRELTKKYPEIPFKNCKALIELDRQGTDDCVFYQCANNDWIKKVESYGFTTQQGSFTDIRILMTAWNIVGVNLSCGYYNEHCEGEFLVYSAISDILTKLMMMLDDCESWKDYKYIEDYKTSSLRSWMLASGNYCMICDNKLEKSNYHDIHGFICCNECYDKYYEN